MRDAQRHVKWAGGVRRGGRALLLAALGSLLLAGGCTTGDREHRAWMVDGERAYNDGRYQEAIGNFSRVISARPPAEDLSRAHYSRALAQAKLGQRGAAYRDLQDALRNEADQEVTWRSCTMLGTLLFEDRRWEAAAKYYGHAIARMPAEPPMDFLLVRLGQSLERAGQWSQSRRAFQRLADQFPTSRYADVARRRLELKADHFAIQAGVFSQAESARTLAAQLDRKGLPATVRREPRGGRIYNVVLVGRYPTYQQAWDQLPIVRKYISDAVIWP